MPEINLPTASKQDEILAKLNAGVVKSVQRGSALLTNGLATIPISPVNLNKAFITFNGFSLPKETLATQSAIPYIAYLSNSNTLIIKSARAENSMPAQWEVVEFN